MEFEVMAPSAYKSSKTNEPTVRFNLKSGLITFNAGAVTKLKLTEVDRLLFLWSPSDKTHYLTKSSAEDSFSPRVKKEANDTVTMSMNATALVKKISERHDTDGNFTLKLGNAFSTDNYKEVWPLLFSKISK